LVSRLGRVSEAQGDVTRANMLYSEALEGFQRDGDMAGAGEMLVRLGIVSARMGDIARAEDVLAAAEQAYLRVNALPGAARADLALAAIALQAGDLAIAAERALRALEFAKTADAQPLVAISTYAQGIAELKSGRFDDALQLLESAVARSRRSALPFAEAHGLAALSSLLDREGHADAASAAGSTAARLFERLGVPQNTPEEALLKMLG
jgi:tetratricopeptide (TPR) repeat protein